MDADVWFLQPNHAVSSARNITNSISPASQGGLSLTANRSMQSAGSPTLNASVRPSSSAFVLKSEHNVFWIPCFCKCMFLVAKIGTTQGGITDDLANT